MSESREEHDYWYCDAPFSHPFNLEYYAQGEGACVLHNSTMKHITSFFHSPLSEACPEIPVVQGQFYINGDMVPVQRRLFDD